MSKRPRRPPAQPGPDITWVYWVSRNSLNGVLSETCRLWNTKPKRERWQNRELKVTWHGPGLLGEFKPHEIAKWFRVYPETDLELIVVETRPSQAEYDAAMKALDKQ